MPTIRSSSTALAMASFLPVLLWWRMFSTIWLPTVMVGFSAARASWKMIAASPPRYWLSRFLSKRRTSSPLKRT